MNMKVTSKIKNWNVGQLIEYEKEKTLRVNSEYQRGLRWTTSQKQMFIDSIFRGYSIPAFYLHKTVAKLSKNVFYDIVDGQQRIDAIKSFSEGAFELRDPTAETGLKFPNFMKDEPCPWGGKRFADLPTDLQDQLKNHEIVVYEIDTNDQNCVRDLFIRLQGGTPLTPQDKRDSWPGNFTEFVLRVGGKSNVERWYGCPLFVTNAKVNNESKRRQLVAQIFMLHWVIEKEKRFCDIKSANIDEFYHAHVGFDENSQEAKAFLKVCKKLHTIFEGPKLYGHYLIHLFLLTSQLIEGYASGWESQLAGKWHEFDMRLKQARDDVKANKEGSFNPYYHRYGRHTQTQADTASTIQQRHAFFVEEMLKLLAPEPLDPLRVFSALQRQTIFFRDKGLCQWSRMKEMNRRVPWDEMEIHHVIPHVEGGRTDIRNAALVHRDQHPKSAQDVAEFAQWWRKNNLGTETDLRTEPSENMSVPPEGTQLKFLFRDVEYLGEYQNGKIVLTDSSGKQIICLSLSEASKKLTRTSRNGWKDWHFKLPGQTRWILADDWRNKQNTL
ncbi:MAG: DUF262 domain-containing protein [Aestuariivita sp.]|nr:DUF262 domain-containing protein [Aestuariivita sp.]MCY4346896.1 DUF262 domain-containing protein [Aestuariivita sp.]